MKYHNKADERRGIKFDSKKEAARYDELLLMLRCGKIRKLKLQPEFTLQEAFKTPDGETVRAIKYRADFSYEILQRHNNGDGQGVDEWEPVVEDVKSSATKTPQYLIKKKMLLDKGIRITEV